MKRSIYIVIFFCLFPIFSGCQGSNLGGTEAGNPNFRDVTGEVGDATTLANAWLKSLLKSAHADNGCVADTVIFTDSDAETTVADVDSECLFTATLATETSYSVSLVKDDGFVATVIFSANADQESSVFYLSEDDNAVDFGIISITDGFANCSENPYEQNDQDGDGENDYEDQDDDNNEVDDSEEYLDCNDDGIIDDTTTCEIEDGDSVDGEDDN